MQAKKSYRPESDWIDILRPQLLSRLQMLKEEAEYMESKIQTAPQGNIRASKHGKGFQYYLRTVPKDPEGKYIRKRELNKASRILQNEYDQKLLIEIKQEIIAIERYLNSFKEDHLETIFTNMPIGKQALISPIISPENDFIAKWEAVKYTGKGFGPNEPEFYTKKNERVRSKTERAIANALFSHGIPYRYEYPISIKGITYHPDFYCLNVSRRKEIIWEHYGMMDDIGYVRDNVDKNAKYQLAGYIPGDNFIFTFETSRCPLNDRLIERNIELFLLN